MFIAVKPTSVFTTEDVLKEDIERRKCWTADEKPLRYHNNYTRANCLSECMATIMERTCGCIPYYMRGGYHK